MSDPKTALEPQATPETPKKTLAQKILEIQDKVGVVNKRGKFDSGMGGGNYLRIEDAVVAVNKLLTANKLILTGTIKTSERVPHVKGEARAGYISSVLMEWTVEDTESNESRTWSFPGDGYDGTDKAVYKAMTGSRKYAIINIFNLPIGNDVEEHGAPTGDELKGKQKAIAANKIAAAAAAGNKTAIDAMSQVAPDKKLIITRPDEYNGHYIIASGFIAVPQLDTFFSDTDCKRIDSRKTGKIGWKVPSDYEKGLLLLCEKLGIEIEG
jgi:ERF superfamily